MKYYNIHTHCPLDESSVIYIRSVSVEPTMIPFRMGEGYDNVYYSVGIHPWYIECGRRINDGEKQIALFYKELAQPRVVAVGECGLDKQAGPPMDIQERFFLLQAQAAEKVKKPLIIHCVKAWSELIACKKKLSPTVPWIIHGFRGKPELLNQLWDHGFYFSLTDRFNEQAITPDTLSRLFVETDDREMSTYEVYEKLAASLNMNIPVVMEQIGKNVHKVFSI